MAQVSPVSPTLYVSPVRMRTFTVSFFRLRSKEISNKNQDLSNLDSIRLITLDLPIALKIEINYFGEKNQTHLQLKLRML